MKQADLGVRPARNEYGETGPIATTEEFTAALLAIPLVQLLPLSPGLKIWPAAMINVRDIFDLLGRVPPALHISAAPEATWLAWLSILPAVALFWATAELDRASRRALCFAIVLVGLASVALGLLQLANGPNSEFRFYEFTNREEAVGFFANRNHFAAFMYCALVFTGAVTMSLVAESRTVTGGRDRSALVLAIGLTFCLMAAMTAMQAMARSRAGVLLHGAALISLMAMAPPALRSESGRSRVRLAMILAAVLSVAVMGELLLYRFIDRFAYESVQTDARVKFAANTIAAARAYMPFGSGLGTFVRVYGQFERPEDTLMNRFANHAHNDWLELWLETGVAGLVLAGVFVAWVLGTAVRLWRRPPPDVSVFDAMLPKAGVLVLMLLLLHSVVDYPVRTEAIMAVFAVAAGLQLPPPPGAESEDGVAEEAAISKLLWRKRRRRRKSAEAEPQLRPAADGTTPAAEEPRSVQAQSTQRWSAAGTAWPDAWSPGSPGNVPKSPANQAPAVERPAADGAQPVKPALTRWPGSEKP